ncbi:protein timeless-like isoform X1 [Cydia pomonella]|uniref:protein timeless-like isoform X1 n=1 Tax=Cydia pomonella TaxID=82600 RepID=UPI002ADE8C07|nr:protein timeless-like isoform X1 [Cydia pomonella]XP_061707872.1 protein timeless-like isoform X1 [Cydia pomonella]XP_061707873.1 protein timeless-like isoform X1 [Cydia pomonella]
MEWVLSSPQIHSIFSNLGFMHADGYHVNDNCNAALETILNNILTEDKYLRTYRRSISCGQNIKKDLIPLLIHAKEEKTIELLVRILVNLSIPIECLLSVEVTSQSDFGLHTVFEINQLLTATKVAFTGPQATKVVVDFLKKNVYPDQPKVSPAQCTNISNSLLLLRNILHIPEDVKSPISGNNGSGHAVQNQILWNMFSQSVDKVLIKLMIIPEATNWGVTMVQLIALMYKDQHVITLHKLLNMWLESCNSESSEDNESNTSPPDRGSEDSSPMMTSDPTSDSSDTGGSGKSNDEPNSETNVWGTSENNTMKDENQQFQPPLPDENDIHMRDQDASTGDENMKSDNDNEEKVVFEDLPTEPSNQQPSKTEKKGKGMISENSDCGYGTQIENQESISTSSNDDEMPLKKRVHQKPHNPKQRVNTKARTGVTLQERRRKKISKRGKANIENLIRYFSTNVQGLTHQTPTDDDISYVLKEFTVDFLLKGYNSLVQTLHSQILTNVLLEIDTSHFFWLVTYFLKFATQIELDIEQISGVISFDIVSYLTAEGVNLCEQFELAVKLDRNNLKPSSRRLHLVVTAIREFVQAIEVYQKIPHICAADKDALIKLQNKMCETNELRSLLVLLLRHYNPKYHSKQYLQDLVVTNHILLTFLDNAIRNPSYLGSTDIVEHIKQFATPEIMYQYGLLLEDYAVNGAFINDCVFTIMHHVGGELDSLISLYQPKILKTFTSIWKSEFEICDDWSDLIEYVINTFIKKPHALLTIDNFRMDTQIFDDKKVLTEHQAVVASAKKDLQPAAEAGRKKSVHSSASQSSKKRWTEDELSTLNWNYLQCNTHPDVIGEMLRRLKEDGTVKSRDSVIRELYKQNIINKEEYEKLSKFEVKTDKGVKINKEMRDVEIGKLCEQLRQDGKTKCFDWVQQVLLETCYAKLQIEKRYRSECSRTADQTGIHQFKLFNQGFNSPVMSPVSYHALLLNQSVPLVPWNCEQAAMCKDLKFLQLLHKLGFQMPVDTGKVFIRIPHVWSAGVLYEVAGRVAVIDTTKLKFSVTDITSSGSKNAMQQCNSPLSTLTKDVTSMSAAPENFYQIHKQKHIAAIMNFTPRPGSSFNTDVQNESKRCWLEVVQQSQDLKLTCTVGSVLEDVEELAKSKAPSRPAVQPAAAAPARRDVSQAPCSLPPKDFIAQLSELEDNNSVSETASVASDLTRMYVSDEEEKLEIALRPSVAANAPGDGDGCAGRAGRAERSAAERPSVYAPTF